MDTILILYQKEKIPVKKKWINPDMSLILKYCSVRIDLQALRRMMKPIKMRRAPIKMRKAPLIMTKGSR